jgi:hypothetical protein
MVRFRKGAPSIYQRKLPGVDHRELAGGLSGGLSTCSNADRQRTGVGAQHSRG